MIIHRSHIVGLGALVAALVAQACASTSSEGGTQTNWIDCKDDGDCPGSDRCVAKVCVTAVTADASAHTVDRGGTSGGAGGSSAGGGTGSPRAQAAILVRFISGTAPCAIPGADLFVPPDPVGVPNAISSELLCNTNDTACTPDQYVAVQGDPDVTVACTVSPSASAYTVDVSITTPRLHFQAAGPIVAGTGTFAADVDEQSSGQKLQYSNCKVSVDQRFVRTGAIWAWFQCDGVNDPQYQSGAACITAGYFLFENCGG